MTDVEDFFPDLTALEKRFVAHAASGDELDCAAEGRTPDDLDRIEDWSQRVIRARVLSALCLGEVPNWSIHPQRGVRLRGAYIVGRLDLSRAQLEGRPIAFDMCRFADGMVLDQSQVGALAVSGCQMTEFSAEELQSTASLDLSNSRFTQLILTNAIIGTVLYCAGVQLRNGGGTALSGAGLSAARVSLTNLEAWGEINLAGAKIRGDLECVGATLTNKDGRALFGDSLSASYVFLHDAEVLGEINLLRAEIRGSLECDGATLTSEGMR